MMNRDDLDLIYFENLKRFLQLKIL